MMHDVFISYRREGGDKYATYLSKRLRELGFNPFFDVESMKAGKFNDQIYQYIEECPNFIVILPKNGMDRCSNKDDWLRLEIAHALKLFGENNVGRKIIPIFLSGFTFPDDLPENIVSIKNFEGITPDELIYDDVIDKLSQKLIHPTSKKKTHRNIIIGVIGMCLILCILASCMMFVFTQQPEMDVNKLYSTGEEYYTAENYGEALKYYKKAADAGEPLAMLKLGNIYYMGTGVEKNPKTALEWYIKSANAGYNAAGTMIGFLYELGIGTAVDYESAVYWYTKAAEGGDAEGMYNLGYMYMNGFGVEQNNETAVYWFTKAADSGDSNAMSSLGYLYYFGAGTEKNYEKALYWTNKAADVGSSDAMNNLGYMYDEGFAVPQDYTKAMTWYLKAAEYDQPNAMKNIAKMYEEGKGVDKNLTLATEWYAKAETVK